jgi:hypothetical protein
MNWITNCFQKSLRFVVSRTVQIDQNLILLLAEQIGLVHSGRIDFTPFFCEKERVGVNENCLGFGQTIN